MAATRKARALAVMSEVLRRHVEAPEAGDESAPDESPLEAIAEGGEALEKGDTTSATCHRLAVAYGRHANEFIGEEVFRDAVSRLGAQVVQVEALADRVDVRTPARLAFSSSHGSDISYIVEEKSAVILNCAIAVGGALPGRIALERTREPRIELFAQTFEAEGVVTDHEEVFGALSPTDPLVLLKAGLRHSGVLHPGNGSLHEWLTRLGGGLRVAVESAIPRGSGLGCSGILAAGLVRGLREMAGLQTSIEELLLRSYCCERCYGRSGYQDIIGGCLGGVKLIQADGSGGLFRPRIEALELSREQLAGIRENLVVFYTGAAHRRQPYLLTVPAKYFMRSSDYLHAYENGKRLTFAMTDALIDGDWEKLGALIGEYWDDREFFEPGVTPDFAARFRGELAPLSYGTALCGSGYGGFMMVVPRAGRRETVLQYLAEAGVAPTQILDFEVVDRGLEARGS
jgi:galactokinase/mevalonate kinase-like predicted kinase